MPSLEWLIWVKHPSQDQPEARWGAGAHTQVSPWLYTGANTQSLSILPPPLKASHWRWAWSNQIQPLSLGTWTAKPPGVPTISFPSHQESGKSWTLEGLNEVHGHRRISGGRKHIGKGRKNEGKENKMDSPLSKVCGIWWGERP